MASVRFRTQLIAVLIVAVLIGLVAVPLLVIEKARRDATAASAFPVELEFQRARLDSKSLLIFEFRGPAIIDASDPSRIADATIQWKLYPWGVYSAELN